MKPTRDGYGEGLLELGRIDKNVVALCADLTASTRANWFRDKYPDRFFEMGVAEQDMFSTAAGLALAGKIPYCSTFGVFASGRGWDQIRISICYMNLNVKIAGTHGGVTVGPDGATHHALEEITLMRSLPNMKVLVPCDSVEAKQATIKAKDIGGPVYLRLGREPMPILTNEDDAFEIGKAKVLKDGSDVTIVACGIMVSPALEASDMLKKGKISARVINLHTVKPIDREVLIKAAQETGAIVTAEEHTIMGGMGGAVSEVVTDSCPVPVKMVGMRDSFGVSGEPQELLKHFKLTKEAIVEAAHEALKMKCKR